MKSIKTLCTLIALTIVASTAQAEDDGNFYYPRLPYSSWGEISLGKNGLLLGSYFEQGVDWLEVREWRFNTFAGIKLNASEREDDYWDNKVAPVIGLKIRHDFIPHEGFWGGVDIGIQAEENTYFGSHGNKNGLTYFANWGLGGDWKKFNKTTDDNTFPLGYPISSWGQISHSTGDLEEGTVLSGYVEQGVDWARYGEWTANTFLGFRFVESNKDDPWNNKVSPWAGVKVKRPVELFPGSWGEISIGVRAEFDTYTDGSTPNDTAIVGFLQWSFGGDWKTKNQ